MPTARATLASHRARAGLGLSVGIAIALGGCSRPYPVPLGEAGAVDYQMAGMLADSQTRSGAIARGGLVDGYLSAAEANKMWTAWRAERDARDAEQKAEVIKRWARK